ncbi:spermidine synthase isoform X2 [Alligator mississippiensis]|uniref:spermidine synthase isoform X2 n=1 Tax=Alligator mississippiensis TaxID=8496 RepID=UPI0028780BCA|nr:spermidine synthase isoform X2 [Alligator mississippiensis]
MRIYPAVGRRGLHKADACPGLELSGGGLALCPPNPEARGGKEDPPAQQPGQVRPLRPVSRNVALLLPGVRSIPGPAPRPPLCAEPRPPAAGPAPRRPALAGAPPRGPHGAGRTNMLARLSEAAPTAGQWRGRRGAGARRALAAGGRRGASLGPRAGSAAPRGQVRRGRGMEPERPQQAPSAAIREGWFRETCSLWPGQAMSLQVDELLYAKRSRFQEILVFRSKTYGNVLVLDGVIQCTERDEFSYQEMIANLPLCSHPSPRKQVLIIGGGDGGVLREVVKHPSVESVVQCEIDEDVIKVSKQYLQGMAVGYSSPKLTLRIGDGFEFMQQNQEAFDVIITDSSDPVGPAESLFKESYYELMKTALRKDGILCCQG